MAAEPPPAAPPPAPADPIAALVDLGIRATMAYDRPDLQERIRAVQARLARPDVVVCVVGEFKKGKSSLVNALLGTNVCPVDDDFATTAVTVLRYGAEAGATVRRRETDAQGSRVLEEEVPVEQIAEFVSESKNPGNARQVELVEVRLPHALLQRGVTIVDTPGIGSLSAGHAAATLAFLPSADALIFVSDASQELAAPEVEFLERARRVCPLVLMALTKVDLYPQWRRIASIDEGHLARTGAPLTPMPVSSALRRTAISRQDREMNQESGFPVLLGAIQSQVIDQAQRITARAALVDVRAAVQQMHGAFETERTALSDPAIVEGAVAEATRIRGRLEHLRGPGARWSTVLNDGFADLSSSVDYQFRSAMRNLSREVNAAIDAGDPATTWDALGEQIQTQVATAVEGVFTALRDGAADIRSRIVELLGEEHLTLESATQTRQPLDVHALWQDRQIDRTSVGSRLGSGMGVVRGAQGGLFVFGFLTNLMGLVVMGPALLGVGAAFGGKAFLDDRKRQVATRRQQARQFFREFEESTQFEIGAQVRDSTRDLQRGLRDEFSARLAELGRTYEETLAALKQATTRDHEDRQTRAAVMADRVSKLGQVLAQVDAVERTL